MSAIELITVQATAPGAGAAMTALTGNSLTIRDSRKDVYLIKVWQQRQAAGFTRILSPLIHDAVVGMGGVGPIGESELYEGWDQPLRAQDNLTVTGSGSAGVGDIEHSSMLVYYEELPGSHQHLIDYAELMRRGEAVYSFSNTLALTATGQYTGSELITAEEDQLKANREYAWIGSTVQVGAAAVRLTGTDFGNLGVGMPATALDNAPGNGLEGSRFWSNLSRRLDHPLIPVVNSSNKSNTFIDGVTDENGVDAIVKTHFVLLSPGSARRVVGRKKV